MPVSAFKQPKALHSEGYKTENALTLKKCVAVGYAVHMYLHLLARGDAFDILYMCNVE